MSYFHVDRVNRSQYAVESHFHSNLDNVTNYNWRYCPELRYNCLWQLFGASDCTDGHSHSHFPDQTWQAGPRSGRRINLNSSLRLQWSNSLADLSGDWVLAVHLTQKAIPDCSPSYWTELHWQSIERMALSISLFLCICSERCRRAYSSSTGSIGGDWWWSNWPCIHGYSWDCDCPWERDSCRSCHRASGWLRGQRKPRVCACVGQRASAVVVDWKSSWS